MGHDTRTFPLEGGLDTETSIQEVKPGTLIACSNYEASATSGYDRCEGYEGFDGRTSPSDASYYKIPFDASTTLTPTLDTSLNSTTSGGTSILLAIVFETGAAGQLGSTGYLIVTNMSGTFADNDNLQNNGSDLCTQNGNAAVNGEDDATLHDTYALAAWQYYRDLITAAPTGSGAIRGVWMYQGDVYAFRDNAGGTAGQMYKSSTSGWTLQDLGGSVTFDTGSTAAPTAGQTITQAVSGATGVLIDVVYTGSWGSNTATGRLFLHTISGTFDGTNNLSWTGGTAVATGTVVNTLPAGGTYEFVNHNFEGGSGSEKMYGVNGVGRAFQWDGTGFAFLYTSEGDLDITIDTPDKVVAHKYHLFLGVQNSLYVSSISGASVGTPLEWSTSTGAGEIQTGDKVTGLSILPGDNLAVFGRNSIRILSGSSGSWSLTDFTLKRGAIDKTVQGLGNLPLFLDDQGIRMLDATQDFGDFRVDTITERVERILYNKTPIQAIQVRSKSQYRLFFNDKTVLTLRDMGRMKRKYRWAITNMILEDQMNCVVSCEDAIGNERIFCGDDSGNVYEMESGNSFDGADITYLLRIAFNHLGHPRRRKRFFKAVVDMDNTEIPDLNCIQELSYGDPSLPLGETQSLVDTVTAGGDYFDSNASWGEFYWDGQYAGQAEAYLDGSGISMGLLMYGSENIRGKHRLYSVSLHYGLRGIKK